MKTNLITVAALVATMAGPVAAESLDRNALPVSLLFERGNVLQFSMTAPRPNVSAAPVGSTGSVLDS